MLFGKYLQNITQFKSKAYYTFRQSNIFHLNIKTKQNDNKKSK